MKMELTSCLLALACLGGSSVALADHSTRGASSEFKWETERNQHEISIFRVETFRSHAVVLVHVDQHERGRHVVNRGEEGEHGVVLEGCGPKHHVYVHEGETVRCTVLRGGEGLTARSLTCDEEKGTVQETNI